MTVNDLAMECAVAVADEIGATGGRSKAVGGDVSDEVAVAAMVDATVAAFGAVTLLVNNAGYVHQAFFVDLQPNDWDRMMAVHARGDISLHPCRTAGHDCEGRGSHCQYRIAVGPDRGSAACPLQRGKGGNHWLDQVACARGKQAGCPRQCHRSLAR